MKIYLASSWRNERQPHILKELRALGYEVYDFRNPSTGGPPGLPDSGFSWSEIDPNWQQWTPEQYLKALQTKTALRGLESDFRAMIWSDAVVAVQPFGRSTALELGWGIGAGKHTAVLLAPGQEPELMQGLADKLCLDLDELKAWLAEVSK